MPVPLPEARMRMPRSGIAGIIVWSSSGVFRRTVGTIVSWLVWLVFQVQVSIVSAWLNALWRA